LGVPEKELQKRSSGALRYKIPLGLGIIMLPMILNDICGLSIPIIRFLGRKIDKKYKHLSNFSSVTLQAVW
jgi:hypothetical protein